MTMTEPQDVVGFMATLQEILKSDLSDGAKLAAFAELGGAANATEVAAMVGKPVRTVERHYAEMRRLRKSADTQICGSTQNCVSEVRKSAYSTTQNCVPDTQICVPSRVDSNIIYNTTQEEVINNTPLPPKPKSAAKASGPTPLEALKAFEAYNAKALELGLPQAAKLTPDRSRKIIARLRDYGLDGWQRALENIGRSKFLMGETPQGFRADLDFLCQAKSLGKLHDGGYGSDRQQRASATAMGAYSRRRELTADELERIAMEYAN